MRRGARLPLEQLAPYLLETSPPRGPQVDVAATPVSWRDLFGNDHPVEIEVGFGKGLFLTNAGQARLDTNFLGIEIERKYVLLAATRLAKRGLANVKVACCDARWYLAAHVATGSVAAVHVYFPDPWWKNRHRKRKLLTAEFAAQCVRVLCPTGKLLLATDVNDYFVDTEKMLGVFEDLRRLPDPRECVPEHDLDYLTNFERKYRREGRPIYRAAWEKSSSSARAQGAER